MSEMKTPVHDAPTGTSTKTGRVVGVPRRWLAALLVIVTAPWLVVGALWMWPADGADGGEPAVAAGAPSPALVGPWGELVVTPVTISPPIEYVSRTWGELQPSVWHFPPMTGDELETQLVSFGIGRDDAVRLRNTARSAAPVSGLFVVPDAALVAGLTPDVRARTYLWLGRSAVSGYTDKPINFDQVSSYRFFGDSIDEWLNAPLSPETRRLVEPYIYRHDGFMYFADIEQVRSGISDADELQRLAKRLLRHATVLAYLRVPEASAVDRVAEYWGRGGRRTDLRPLLESVKRSASGTAGLEGVIDISHLLPVLARDHLYRYPRPSVEDLERPLLANCLWTVLNFFNPEPDDRYLDPAVSMAALKSDYYLVQDNFQLGDVVAFSDRHGNLVHVAVYLAGDLLFSKNGTAPLSPWSILPLDRFKGHYVEYGDDWQVTYHRRKDM
jgi:hypothetical protein